MKTKSNQLEGRLEVLFSLESNNPIKCSTYSDL